MNGYDIFSGSTSMKGSGIRFRTGITEVEIGREYGEGQAGAYQARDASSRCKLIPDCIAEAIPDCVVQCPM